MKRSPLRWTELSFLGHTLSQEKSEIVVIFDPLEEVSEYSFFSLVDEVILSKKQFLMIYEKREARVESKKKGWQQQQESAKYGNLRLLDFQKDVWFLKILMIDSRISGDWGD